MSKQSTDSGENENKRGERTTWAQRQQIIVWLEQPENFNLIEGRAQCKYSYYYDLLYMISIK
jgi:hypothetical protein